MADRRYEPHPICPHCERPMSDAWELDLDEGRRTEVWCGWCDASYFVTKHVTVEYSSRATDDGEG